MTATPPPLPEIGRVRANSPACVVLRDIVIPSFSAVRRGDDRFRATRAHLVAYARINGDPFDRTSVSRDAALAQIDRDAAALLSEEQVLNRALGDPRIAESVSDPQVITLRAQLQALFATQYDRAVAVLRFSLPTRAGAMREEDGGSAFDRRSDAPTPVPLPSGVSRSIPNFPALHGIGMQDQDIVRQWADDTDRIIVPVEDQALRTTAAIAETCR